MDQNNLDKPTIEYRLTYKTHDDVEVTYFPSVNAAYSFITDNRILTFNLVKEQLIASRFDTGE